MESSSLMKNINQHIELNICVLLLMVCLLMCCDVENVSYSSQMHNLPTELNLSDAYFINKDIGYVSAGGIFTSGLLFKTEDGGTTWDTLSTYDRGINSLSYQNGIFSASACGQKLYSSSDFDSWQISTAYEGWWNWHKHARLNDNQVLLVGGENLGSGFLHHWAPNQGSTLLRDTFSNELRDIAVNSDRTIHVVGYGLIMKSTDDGNSWITSTVSGDFFRGVDFPSNQIGYVVGEYGTVYKTTNRGNSWNLCRGGNAVFADQTKLLRDIAFIDEQTGFIVGIGNTVHRTIDGGKTWKRIQNLDGYADFNAIRIQHKRAYLTGNSGKLLIIDLQ